MRRLLFMLLLIGAIAGCAYIILFEPAFFNMNITNTEGGGMNDAGYITGANLLETLWRQISSFDFNEFEWNSTFAFRYYAVALFLLINAIIVVYMALRWLLGKLSLRKWDGIYSMSTWFLISAILLSAAYVWFAIDSINIHNSISEGAGFSIRLFPLWAYIPLVASIVMVILASAFKGADGIRD